MAKQQPTTEVKPLDYFADIKSVTLPDSYRQALVDSGRDPIAWQSQLNGYIAQGGEAKEKAITQAFTAFDTIGQTSRYTKLLENAASAKAARQSEVQSRREQRAQNIASPDVTPATGAAPQVQQIDQPNKPPVQRVSGTTALMGSVWNSVLGLAEGTADFLNDTNQLSLDLKAKLPWASSKDIADAQIYRQQYDGIKKSIDKGFSKAGVEIDETTKQNPVSFKTGTDGHIEIDLSQAADANKWLAGVGSGVGSLVSILAPTKKASFLMSFAQMYGGNQDDAHDAGLKGTEATLYATGTSLVQSALELAGEAGILNALKGNAGKEVIKRVVKDKSAQAISDLASKGITKELFNDVVEKTFKESVAELSNQGSMAVLKKQVGNLGRKFAKGALPEAATEFAQEWASYGAQRGYNNLMGDAQTSPGNGEFQTDAYKTLEDATYGALLGGFLGGTIGSFAPNSKEMHETLGAFVNADIKEQLKNNPNATIEELKTNARVKSLLDVATQNGQFNDANGQLDQQKLENVAKKADLLYDSFYEFKDMPNLDAQDRLSMFNITDTRNNIQAAKTQFEGAKQQVDQLQAQADQAKSEGNSLAATKLEAQKATIEQQLGDKNPQTGEYLAMEDINNQSQQTEALFQQALPEITSQDDTRKGMGRSFLNSNLFPDQDFSPDTETVLPDGSLIVRDNESTAIRQVNTIPVQPATDIVSQLDKGKYKPIQRFEKQYVPISNYQNYAQAAANIANNQTAHASAAATSPFDYRQDAADLIGVTAQAAQTLNTNPSVYDAISDRVTKAYDFYTQIIAQDQKSTTPSVPVLSEEDFQNVVGFLPSVNGKRVDPFEQTILAKQKELNIPAAVADVYTPSNDSIDTILDIEGGDTTVPVKRIDKAISELTATRKLWQNKRKASGRAYTLAQIDDVVAAIENDLNTLASEKSYQQAPELRPEPPVVAPIEEAPVNQAQEAAPIENNAPIETAQNSDTNTESAVSIQNIKDYAKASIEGQSLPQRLSPEIESGRAEGGIRNVEASLIARGFDSTDESTQNESRLKQERDLEAYAKEEGIWYENPDKELGEYYGKGFESSVYYTPDRKSLLKVNNLASHKDILTFFDRIAMHNYLFPETKYELEGFGRNKRGQFSAIVKQPLVQAKFSASLKDIQDSMKKLGFESVGKEHYALGDFLLSDINERDNALIDKDGNLFYIDPLIELNTAEKGFGGTALANEITDQDILNAENIQPITQGTNENPVSEGTRRNTRKSRSVKQQYAAQAQLASALESAQNNTEPVQPVAGSVEQVAEEVIPSEETDESITELIGQLDSVSEQIGSVDGQLQEVLRKLDPIINETAGDSSGGDQSTAPAAETVSELPVVAPGIVGNVIKQISKAFPNVDVVIPVNLKEFMNAAGLPISAKAPTGFIREGQVYLNPQTIESDPNTPLHEFGHIWTLWARQNDQALYDRGIALLSNSGYLKSVKRDPNYSKLPEQAQQEEALARAIGNNGESFVGNTRKADFKNWVKEVFGRIKEYFANVPAIETLTPEQLSNMEMDQFASKVAADILGGKEISGISSEEINAILNPSQEQAIETPVEEELAPEIIQELDKQEQAAISWDKPSIKPSEAIGQQITFDQAGTPMRGTIEGEEGDSYKIRGDKTKRIYTVPKSEINTNILFSFGAPAPGEQIGTHQELQDKAKVELESAGVFGVLASDLTGAQKTFIANTQKKYGWKYLGASEVNGVKTDENWSRDISKENDSYFLPGQNNEMIIMPLQGKKGAPNRIVKGIQESADFLEKQRVDGNAAYKVNHWLIQSSFKRLNNLETLVQGIDGFDRVLKSVIRDVKREASNVRNRALNIMGRGYEPARRDLGPYSTHRGSRTIDTVEKLPVQMIQWDRATQKSVVRNVLLPLGTIANLVATHQSQRSMGPEYTVRKVKDSAGTEYTEDHTSLVVDSFYDVDPDDPKLFFNDKETVGSVYKGVHFKKDVAMEADAKGDLQLLKTAQQYGLFTQDEMDRLEDFVTNSGPADFREGFKKIKNTFNDAKVRELLNKENEAINPGKPFKVIPDYSPVQSVKGISAQDKVNSFSPDLEDSRQLQERTARPDAVYAEDILDSFDSYKESVGHILGSTKLVHNLKSLQNAVTSDYDGENKGEITEILNDTIKNLQSYRQQQFESSKGQDSIKPLVTLMVKYTANTFRSNIGISTKQLGTMASALGLGYIKNKNLFSADVLGPLLKMSAGGSTIDRTAGGTLIETTGEGFKTALGTDTTEAAYIKEILGQDITDPAEKEKHEERYATVIQRLVYGQNQYTDTQGIGDLKFTSKGKAWAKQLYNKIDSFNEEYGMANIRRLDRAVIIAYYLAAKKEVAEDHSSLTPEQQADLIASKVTETLYLTNQMSDPADLTMTQRNPNFATRLVTMYSGQTQKLWNQLAGSAIEYYKYKDKVTPEEKAILLSRLKGSLVSNAIINPLWMASTNVAVGLFRAALNGDDDKDKNYWRDKFGFDYARYALGLAPGFASELLQTIISNIDNEPWADGILEVPGADTIDQLLKTAGETIQLINQWDGQTEKEVDKTIYDWINNTSKLVGTSGLAPKTWINPLVKRLNEKPTAKGLKEEDITLESPEGDENQYLEENGGEEEEVPEYLYD